MIIVILIACYLLIRVEKTSKFMQRINDICAKATIRAIENGVSNLDEYYKVWGKLSFYDVFLSFKPLKLEKWFTKEEIDLLNKYN